LTTLVLADKVQLKLSKNTVTYRTYIKKDYKPVIGRAAIRPWYRRSQLWLLCAGFILSTTAIVSILPSPSTIDNVELNSTLSQTTNLPSEEKNKDLVLNVAEAEPIEQTLSPAKPEPNWQTVRVKNGDSLWFIFKRLGLAAGLLEEVMASGPETHLLKRILPEQELHTD